MPEAYIVDAVRTPVGKRGGGLSQVHPADLGAHVLNALMDRTGVDPSAVEDVYFGCVDALGPQAGDIARTCWLAAGLPEEVPGVTIDRQCGSSQQAVHFAAQAVMSGTTDLIVAGGVQNMSMIPISSAMTMAEPLGFADPFSGSEGWVKRYGDQEVSQFVGAEMIAEKWNISREDMEVFALESHQRAARATAEGRFETQIVPLGACLVDEGPRPTSTLEKMATLPDARRRWTLDRRPVVTAVGRGDGDARRVRGRSERTQPDAAGAHPPHQLPRRRPDHDAERADPGHRVRVEEDGYVARRHRPRRDQRSVCVRGVGMAKRNRRRPGPAST